jgi:hypothetical protein
MPELNGQPFKWQLREEIHQLQIELSKEITAHRETKETLEYYRAMTEELEAKIGRMQEKSREIVGEAEQKITPGVVVERIREIRHRDIQRWTQEALNKVKASEVH